MPDPHPTELEPISHETITDPSTNPVTFHTHDGVDSPKLHADNLPAAGGTPGGADTQVQFNDGGAFGGDASLTWNKTSNILTIGDAELVASIETPDGVEFGGGLNIKTGTGQDGGYIHVTAADGMGADGIGGEITLNAGAGTDGGGQVLIQAGNSTGNTGGAITLNAGLNFGTGDGGAIDLNAGSVASGAGGSIGIAAGSGNGDVGGSISISSGGTDGTHNAGDISFLLGSGMRNARFVISESAESPATSKRVVGTKNTTDNSYHAVTDVFSPAASSAGFVHARVVGHRTSGSGGTANDSFATELCVGIKNAAGTVTLMTAITYIYLFGDNGVVDAKFAVNGTNIELQVKGDTNNNYTFTYELWYMNV